MMEDQSFLKFCKRFGISSKNQGSALGKKLQKLDPNVRVSCVYNLLGDEDLLTRVDLFAGNDLLDIRCHQDNIKVTYVEFDHLTAVRSATLIIQSSKANTIEARFAYGCRASSLYALKQYHECIYDANRSLREQWDAKERNLMTRQKLRCLKNLKNSPRYQINADDLDPDYKGNFELPMIENPHEWIPSASKKIQSMFSTEYGRHLEAAEDISPGELLFVDKPYAYVLNDACELTNCSHCFIRCMALISCPSCKTSFCSDSCRAQAFSQYHRIECQVVNNSKSKIFDMESRLALRMLMIATRQGQDVEKLSEHPIYGNPFDLRARPIDRHHSEEDYYHIHHLKSHEKELKNFDLVRLCYKAAVLLESLKWTTFFEVSNVEGEAGSLTKEQQFVSTLLLRYLTFIKFNGTMIRDRVERPKKFRHGAVFFDVFQTGLALYPICSLLNHSCNSNALIVSFKTSCACYATQPILKGEQICINYECHYLLHSLEYRRKKLEDYYFNCQCRACKENWPGMLSKPKLERISSRLSKEEMQRYENKMEELVKQRDVKERCKPEQMNFLQDLMTKFYSNTTHPNVTYENAMTLLKSILIAKGNNYELVDDPVICKYCYFDFQRPTFTVPK